MMDLPRLDEPAPPACNDDTRSPCLAWVLVGLLMLACSVVLPFVIVPGVPL